MPSCARLVTACVVGCLIFTQIGCHGFPRRKQLRAAQYRSWQLWSQNQSLMQANASLEQEKLAWDQERSSLAANSDSLQKRLDNLQAERQELNNRYMGLISKSKTDGNPLSESATQALKELQERFPEFEFDPATGVSKFHSDILFDSGSDEVKPAAVPLLQEFARILNSEDAQRLNILVVGHTDNRPIVKAATKANHRDNWDLSADRAASVTRVLGKQGIKDNRMGIAGYGPYQAVAPNVSEENRKQNRRVEIFVLAPDATIAGYDNKNKVLR